jgi:hypothetical protein
MSINGANMGSDGNNGRGTLLCQMAKQDRWPSVVVAATTHPRSESDGWPDPGQATLLLTWVISTIDLFEIEYSS